VPTKQLLAQMKFRPWNGVFLSEHYLSSVEAAESVTAELLHMYHEEDIVPLVESKVATDEQMKHVLQLLATGCGAQALQPGNVPVGGSTTAGKREPPRSRGIDQPKQQRARRKTQ
jgi:hypothetical protein